MWPEYFLDFETMLVRMFQLEFECRFLWELRMYVQGILVGASFF